MTPYFWKRCFFDMVEKVGFTNCVFGKLCFPENTICIVFQQNTAFQKQKLYVEKNRKFVKNSGLLLNMAKWCFLGLFFWGFNIKRFVFGVSGIVSKVLKMLVFSQFWGVFLGWLLPSFRWGLFPSFIFANEEGTHVRKIFQTVRQGLSFNAFFTAFRKRVPLAPNSRLFESQFMPCLRLWQVDISKLPNPLPVSELILLKILPKVQRRMSINLHKSCHKSSRRCSDESGNQVPKMCYTRS